MRYADRIAGNKFSAEGGFNLAGGITDARYVFAIICLRGEQRRLAGKRGASGGVAYGQEDGTDNDMGNDAYHYPLAVAVGAVYGPRPLQGSLDPSSSGAVSSLTLPVRSQLLASPSPSPPKLVYSIKKPNSCTADL